MLLLVVTALVLAWIQRVSLARNFIDNEFEQRGVQATYRLTRIGFGTQILENLVIGDPARPDATARRVKVQIVIGLTGPRVGLITARGVRLSGRIRDGRLSLGQVDRLLPPPSGLPFRLPDQQVDIADAAIALDTPSGLVALGLTGRGRLSDGFTGRLALRSRSLDVGECAIDRPRGVFAVRVSALRPRLRGPLAIAGVRCGDALIGDRLLFALDAGLAPGLDSWQGGSAVRIAGLASGPQSMRAVQGRLTFSGDADRTAGAVDLKASSAAFQGARADQLRLAGRYAVSPLRGDLALGANLSLAGVTLPGEPVDGVVAALRGADQTPVGPIGAALADALTRAARGGADASARLLVASGKTYGALRLADLRYSARSGARLASGGGEGVTYHWGSGAVRLDGAFALRGGGFPETRLVLRQPTMGAAMTGTARIAPIRAGDARLALGEVRFAAGDRGGFRFSTNMVVDGPIGSGRVTGLSLPLAGRFDRSGLAIGQGCTSASFRSLELEGLRLGSTRLPLCPVGPALLYQSPGGALRAGAELRAPRVAGRLGQSPIAIAADRIRFDLNGFSAAGLAVRLGPSASPNRLDLARFDGRFGAGGISGSYAGMAGKLANVPLLLDEGEGRWRLAGGSLAVEGGLLVSDAADPVRFYPLVTRDLRLTLANNRIEARASLEHRTAGVQVTQVRIGHDLRTGAGAADLDVSALAFGPSFQPDALTPLSVGVVALVEGSVTGRGRIEWDSVGSRSSGTFSTADLDLAAPFGPVQGLSTSVEFTDLLGLVSAPGQVARIALIQPGIDIFDGAVTYQLQPNYHVAIESGLWPYAGGQVLLQPTTLDFSQPSTKYLTFRVDGLDAARFISQMEFSNIAATGTFDGLVPMEFGTGGGRIVGGRLAAREGGGTLSYIGELTDRDLGIYGKMAFDALKALRYDRFDMALDGALDGEFVTVIDLDGIARNPSTPINTPGGAIGRMIAGRVVSQLARIPFQFNIRIQGPFRALLGTARSFEDPSLLIQPVLPRQLRDLPTSVTDVQDEESENEP